MRYLVIENAFLIIKRDKDGECHYSSKYQNQVYKNKYGKDMAFHYIRQGQVDKDNKL